ncbi:hypothetical protein [Leclercia sp.]|uniref:hypothetical protein n=1 Tax=Leclercia sp. TaxID=1898428 RepID=UPI0028B201AC|nr:hypothetical protein [Leclercia sp.]
MQQDKEQRYALLDNNRKYFDKNYYNELKKLIDAEIFSVFDDEMIRFLNKNSHKKNDDEISTENNIELENDMSFENIEENDFMDKQQKNVKEILHKRIAQITRKLLESESLNTKIERDRMLLQHEIIAIRQQSSEKEEKIKQLTSRVEELSGKVQQNRIDEKIPSYVEGVKDKLKLDDKHFIFMSYIWSGFGILFAIGAIIASFITFFLKIDFKELETINLIYVFTRGLLGITLLSWLAYFCLNNSKKYTHESIRRKDRQHALMFGQVFLQIYGSTATKEDAVNVFKDWNMSGDSAFSDQTEHPPGIQSIISSLKDSLPSKESLKEKT